MNTRSNASLNRFLDFSLIDEFFAVFAGATLALSFQGWQASAPMVVFTILLVILATLAPAVYAMNTAALKQRWISYVLVVLLPVGGYFLIMNVSANDLYPERRELLALPLGALFWVIAREVCRWLVTRFDVDKAIEDSPPLIDG